MSLLLTGAFVRVLSLLVVYAPMESQSSPSQTVDSAFAALSRRDWQTLAALVHSAALDSLRQESLGLIILMTEDQLAGKAGGGYNPNQVIVADHLARVGGERVPSFPNSPTIAQLASLSASQFFIAWCGAVYRAESGDDPMRDLVSLKRQTFGAVQEGDTLAHVLYRRESRYIEMGELFIDLPGRVMEMPLRRVADRWMLLLNDDIGWTVDFMGALRPDRHVGAGPLKRTTRVAPPIPPPSTELRAAADQPQQRVATALDAFQQRDWTALASNVDGSRLASFQSEVLAYLIAWSHSRDSRAQAAHRDIGFVLMYDDSVTPAAIAQVAKVKIPIFKNAPTIGELSALSPSAFFARWCEATYGASPGDETTRFELRREVIGQVLEAETLAYVLYRLGPAGSDGRVVLMPVRRVRDGWGILLNEDIGEMSLFSLRLDER